MAEKLTQLLIDSHSWKGTGTSAVGRINGFWYTLEQTGLTQLSTVVLGLTPELTADLRTYLREQADPDFALSEPRISDRIIQFTIPNKAMSDRLTAADRLNRFLNGLSSKMSELGLQPGCMTCGAPGPHKPVLINGSASEVCETCAAGLADRAEQASHKPEPTGNYVTGFIGALIGAAIGGVVWFGVSYAGYFAAIAGFVMAWLAMIGYRLLRGRKTRATPWILLAAIIIMMIIAELMAYTAVIARQERLPFTYVLGFWQEIMQESSFWLNVGLGAIFALLGSFGILRRTNNEAKGEQFQYETL